MEPPSLFETLHRNKLSHNCSSEGGYLYGQSGPRHPQHHLWSHTGLHLHPLLFQNLKQTKRYEILEKHFKHYIWSWHTFGAFYT